MKKIQIVLILLALTRPLWAAPGSPEGEPESLYHEISARLLVGDPMALSRSISSWCEEAGGYFTLSSADHLVLRLPDRRLEDFDALLEGLEAEILDYGRSAFDLREDILRSRSALEARQELLARNLEYLDRSDLEGTLTLEQEIRRLSGEIDSLKGRIAYLENNSRYALINLNLSFRDSSIPEGRPSRFDWINGVDFYAFMNSAGYDEGRGFKGPALPLPEGFALAAEKPWFRAVSPEGVQIRLREEKNYPRQSLEFWSRALFAHMEGLGYIPLTKDEDENLDMGDETFLLRRWGVPYGHKNYVYMTGLTVEGGKLRILEIAGEPEYIRNYFPR